MQYVIFCSGQIILSTLCAFLMKTRKVWLFSAHMLPLLARLFAAPHATLLTVNTFSMGLTGAGITVFLLSHLFLPYRLVKAAYSELLQLEVLLFWNTSSFSFYKESCLSEEVLDAWVCLFVKTATDGVGSHFSTSYLISSHPWFSVPQVIELYRLLAVGISLWNQFAVPVLFSVFWFVLFIVQLCSDAMSSSASAGHQGIMFFLLTRCNVFLCIIHIIPSLHIFFII